MSVLLLGNGLNRCLNGYPSWDGLLDSIAREFYCDLDDEKGAILKYDLMLCTAYGNYAPDTVRLKLKALLNVLNCDSPSPEEIDLFCSVLDSGVKTILTTNFDYNIETALLHCKGRERPGNDTKVKYPNEIRKSNRRHNVIGDVRIHHVHGELNYPRSICLGITKYVENLSKIRELLSGPKTEADKMLDRETIDSKVILGERKSIKTWAEYLFNQDVYIVGLGLSPQEIDLWWLLLRRAQLMSKAPASQRPTNKVIYYALEEDGHAINRASLDALNIQVRPRHVRNGEWADEYRSIFRDIAIIEGRGEFSALDLSTS